MRNSRPRLLWLNCLAIAAAFSASGRAEYAPVDLEKIPVDRLVRNLEKRVAEHPTQMVPRFNLARLHAMAYAQKINEVQILRGKPDMGAWFGYDPAHVPFKAVKSTDEAKLKAAKLHLEKAIALYESIVKTAPDHLTANLGLAWCIDQSGDKQKAITAYRDVIDKAWPKEKDLKYGGLGVHPVTAEAAGYLIPLLDKEKDKLEIASLQQRVKKLENLPREVTPIAIPLRNGLKASDLEDRAAAVAVDADGSGLLRKWTWITRDAGWLVYAAKPTVKITSALQLFGNVTFWCFWDNGYQALASLDENGDGKLTGKELIGLAIWRDANANGVCEPGEVRPLADYGIIGLSCQCERDNEHPDRIWHSPKGVTYRDGTTRPTFDLVLRPK